jgi:hypothetical protein
MNLTDGIKCPAAAGYVVWRPRASGVDQRRRLQRTSAPSYIWRELPSGSRLAAVIEGRLGTLGRSDLSRSSTFRCAHRSVRHHERPLPWKASRLRDSSAGFCLEEAMGLRSGGSGTGGAPKLSHRMVDFKSASRLTLTGQRDDTAGAAFLRFVGTGGRRDGRCMSILDSRKPHAVKVRPHRARQPLSSGVECAHANTRFAAGSSSSRDKKRGINATAERARDSRVATGLLT